MNTINVSKLAQLIEARANCIQSNNTEWLSIHMDSIAEMCKNLPSGSGIDSGMKLDMEQSKRDKLVFTFDYHFMNSDGYYDGWGSYTLIIRPSFNGLDMLIKGKNRDDIKEYFYQMFDSIFIVDREHVY